MCIQCNLILLTPQYSLHFFYLFFKACFSLVVPIGESSSPVSSTFFCKMSLQFSLIMNTRQPAGFLSKPDRHTHHSDLSLKVLPETPPTRTPCSVLFEVNVDAGLAQ